MIRPGVFVAVWLLGLIGLALAVTYYTSGKQERSQERSMGDVAALNARVHPPGDPPVHGAELVDQTYVLLRDVDGQFSISHWIPGLVDQVIKSRQSSLLSDSQRAIHVQIPFLLRVSGDKETWVMAFGGKVIPQTKTVVITLDNGTSSGPIQLHDQYFLYITDGVAPKDPGQPMGPRVIQLKGFDGDGKELFAYGDQAV